MLRGGSSSYKRLRSPTVQQEPFVVKNKDGRLLKRPDLVVVQCLRWASIEHETSGFHVLFYPRFLLSMFSLLVVGLLWLCVLMCFVYFVVRHVLCPHCSVLVVVSTSPNSSKPSVLVTDGMSKHMLSPYNAHYLHYVLFYSLRFQLNRHVFLKCV